jgi:hypothetical protein
MRRNRSLLPLAIGCLAYLAFAIATMDPADAVRYAIPSMPLIALLFCCGVKGGEEAAPGLREESAASQQSSGVFRRPGAAASPLVLLTIVYVAGAVWYAWPVLRARATSASPPYAAAQWIRTHVPKDAVILYDLQLRPQAKVRAT